MNKAQYYGECPYISDVTKRDRKKNGVTQKMIQTRIKIYFEKGKPYFQDEIDEDGDATPGLTENLISVAAKGTFSSMRGTQLSAKDEDCLDA